MISDAVQRARDHEINLADSLVNGELNKHKWSKTT